MNSHYKRHYVELPSTGAAEVNKGGPWKQGALAHKPFGMMVLYGDLKISSDRHRGVTMDDKSSCPASLYKKLLFLLVSHWSLCRAWAVCLSLLPTCTPARHLGRMDYTWV